MNTLRDELNKVIKEEGISKADFEFVGMHKYSSLLQDIAERFLKKGKKQIENAWWWEILKLESHGYAPYDPLIEVNKLLNSNEYYWFIASEEHQGRKWVCKATRDGIMQLLKNAHYFEYYIVESKLHWLIGENHHGALFATGEEMPDKLEALKLEHNK